eukprot:CAMPEP_0174256462 /NCGR_PEP_ID=MMETSP0439-20130205/5687_1 /TAXON_ID=0 /ORGANISM="Stereomyxa ramosa, Strain Chinc5" /LENGTH=162 /DNA_ID=CAMNT_0015339075 /DNA_START=137 /DNA_END=625 /DNA_ORIENTATION=-
MSRTVLRKIPTTNSKIVFSYGTLKQGFRNHYKMNGGAHFLGVGRTKQRFPLVTFGERNVPYLLPETGRGERIEGELYLCDEQKVHELDIFEGAPTYYDRVPIEVETASGDFITVDAYMKKEYDESFLARPFLGSFTKHHNFLYRKRTDLVALQQKEQTAILN